MLCSVFLCIGCIECIPVPYRLPATGCLMHYIRLLAVPEMVVTAPAIIAVVRHQLLVFVGYNNPCVCLPFSKHLLDC